MKYGFISEAAKEVTKISRMAFTCEGDGVFEKIALLLPIECCKTPPAMKERKGTHIRFILE
jgi:hypothetical protein